MNCKECKEAVVLWNELSSVEKDQVERHIQSCEECRELSTEMKQYFNVMNLVSEVKPTHSNAVASMDEIMNAIRVVEPAKNRWSLLDLFNYSAIRYGLTGLSFVFIFLFILEVSSPFMTATQKDKKFSNSVVLESTSFRESFRKRDASKPWFVANCMMPLTKEIDLECIKSKFKIN